MTRFKDYVPVMVNRNRIMSCFGSSKDRSRMKTVQPSPMIQNYVSSNPESDIIPTTNYNS